MKLCLGKVSLCIYILLDAKENSNLYFFYNYEAGILTFDDKFIIPEYFRHADLPWHSDFCDLSFILEKSLYAKLYMLSLVCFYNHWDCATPE